MKKDLALNWSQGVASSHKDEEIASTAEILSLGYVVFWQWRRSRAVRRGSDQAWVAEEPWGSGCRDTEINFGICSHS